MMEGSSYADIVILALIAVFILLRLRSVLGDKVGNDRPSYFDRLPAAAAERAETVVQLDEKALKPKPAEDADPYLSGLGDSEVAGQLRAIKAMDPHFAAARFLQGARGAFEMVFDAFAKGDRDTLKMLLSDSVFQDFSQALAERDAQENKPETTLVSVQAKDIEQAALTGNVARVTVHFVSEQVTVTRDKKGAIVEGSPSDIRDVEDRWVFERDVTSKNPNWKIIET